MLILNVDDAKVGIIFQITKLLRTYLCTLMFLCIFVPEEKSSFKYIGNICHLVVVIAFVFPFFFCIIGMQAFVTATVLLLYISVFRNDFIRFLL